MIHILFTIILYSQIVAASWLYNFPVGWTQRSAETQQVNAPITARYECVAFNSNRWSMPFEATTIYSTPDSLVTNAIAFYRNPKCKDDNGSGLDYLIILDPKNSDGVNVVDLKLEGLTVGGTPASYQAVEVTRYAKAINERTGKPPQPGAVYVFEPKGVVAAWSSAPGTVKNVALGNYITAERINEIEGNAKEMALVLGVVTEKVLSENPQRKSKLAKFVEKKFGGQSAGINLRGMLSRLAEQNAATQVQVNEDIAAMQEPAGGYAPSQAGPHIPVQTSDPIFTWDQRKRGRPSGSRGWNVREELMRPLPDNTRKSLSEERGGVTGAPVVTPYGMANRPIDLYKLANECIKASNRALWFQWYRSNYWFHARLAKAALGILETVESGGVEAVQKMVNEQMLVQAQRTMIEKQIRLQNMYQRARQFQQMRQWNTRENTRTDPQVVPQEWVQDAEVTNGRLSSSRVKNADAPANEPLADPPRRDEEVVILDSNPLESEEPRPLPQNPMENPEPGVSIFPSRLSSGNSFGGLSFSQFAAPRFGMTPNQASDLAAFRFSSQGSGAESQTEWMLKRPEWKDDDIRSMSSEFARPLPSDNQESSAVGEPGPEEDAQLPRGDPQKKLKPS
ncbi:hypothetical protein TWF281_011095 [Arthrobotrys megalospora]